MDSTINAVAKKSLSVFDLETILTRAIYQILNRPQSYTGAYNPIDKNAIVAPSDLENQLKLIAEHLCKRVERRFEKRLHDQQEEDRAQTDKRIQQIRTEYEEELKEYKRRAEKAKQVLEQTLRERERDIQQRSDIRLMDRENELEIRRKFLENRSKELSLVKEQLECASEGFKRKMKEELEAIRIEWEKISNMKMEAEGTSTTVPCIQIPIFKERIIELEKLCDDLKTKLASKEAESFILKQKFDMKAELSNGFQFSADIETLILEKKDLKTAIQQYKKIIDDLNIDAQKKAMQHKLRQEALEFKVNEQKMIISLLNEKVKTLSMERESFRREFLSDSRSSRNYHISELKARRSKKAIIPTIESDDTSDLSTGRTNDSDEIEKIKRRIQNLDVIAKELDVSVEHYTTLRAQIVDNHQSSLVRSEGLDDFCRHQSAHSSPNKYHHFVHEIEEPQRAINKEELKPEEGPLSGSKPRNNTVANIDKQSTQTESKQNKLDDLPPKEVETKVEESAATSDAYFTGIDPVMAQYMRLVGEKRNKEQNHVTDTNVTEQSNVMSAESDSDKANGVEPTNMETNFDQDNDIDW